MVIDVEKKHSGEYDHRGWHPMIILIHSYWIDIVFRKNILGRYRSVFEDTLNHLENTGDHFRSHFDPDSHVSSYDSIVNSSLNVLREMSHKSKVELHRRNTKVCVDKGDDTTWFDEEDEFARWSDWRSDRSRGNDQGISLCFQSDPTKSLRQWLNNIPFRIIRGKADRTVLTKRCEWNHHAIESIWMLWHFPDHDTNELEWNEPTSSEVIQLSDQKSRLILAVLFYIDLRWILEDIYKSNLVCRVHLRRWRNRFHRSNRSNSSPHKCSSRGNNEDRICVLATNTTVDDRRVHRVNESPANIDISTRPDRIDPTSPDDIDRTIEDHSTISDNVRDHIEDRNTDDLSPCSDEEYPLEQTNFKQVKRRNEGESTYWIKRSTCLSRKNQCEWNV